MNEAAGSGSREAFGLVRAALSRWPRTKRLAAQLERWAARRILRAQRPDVVWCNTVVTWRYALESARLGIPTFLYSHEQSEWSSAEIRSRLRNAPPSLRFVACSRSAADALAGLAGTDIDMVAVLSSPVDVDAVRSRAPSVRPSPQPSVVACGTADERKGFDVFRGAAAESENSKGDLRWRWVGRRPTEIGTRTDGVDLIGEVADAVPYLASADVVACPSRSDSFPLVVLEAMALGKPIVGSNLPGIAEQLGDTGVLVRAGDAESLWTAVRDLLNDPERAADLGRRASDRCTALWDIGTFRKRAAQLTESVIADAPRRPVRVAHIMGRLSPGGGVQVVVRRLAEHVDPAEVELHVVTMRPPWDDLSDVPVQLHPLGFDGSSTGPWTRLRIMWAAACTVRRIDPDVVQLHSGVAWLGLMARLVRPRTPFVLEVHDAPGSGRHGAATDRFEGFCVRRLGMIAVCHSSQVERELRDRSRVPVGRIRRYPLGIDTTEFVPISPSDRSMVRSELGISDDCVLALGIGRPAPSKRFDLTIDAVAKARCRGADVTLVLVGVGDSTELVGQRDRLHLGEHVLLLDGRHGAALARLVAASDVLVSASAYEGFGLTLIEGMSCGLPVVATAVGGVTDIVVNDETGYLVTPGSSDELSDRLVSLVEDPGRRHRLGTAGMSRARGSYDARTTALAFANLYRDLTGQQLERLRWRRMVCR